jgi:hypothetical protein
MPLHILEKKTEYELGLLEDFVSIGNSNFIIDYVDTNAPESFYISPKGCTGIFRRKNEKNIKINQQLEKILTYNS